MNTVLTRHLTEELSEEDQQLKGELEMLVERLKVCFLGNDLFIASRIVLTRYSFLRTLQEPDTSLYDPALEQIKTFIKTSTSSVTAVPKPLKFLRPHYDELTELYAKWPSGRTKVRTYFPVTLHGNR